MIITKEQAQLLADLVGQIQEKYGLILAYSDPTLPTPPLNYADFIIIKNIDDDLHCFYKDDVQISSLGPHAVRVTLAEPEHDEKVEKLIDRINNDILDGKLWFDPGVIRIVDELEISVTKKSFPGVDEDVFETNIMTDQYGTVYPYKFIASHANNDKRFRIAKDIIDEVWPRTKKPEPRLQNDTPNFQEILHRLLKLFGI